MTVITGHSAPQWLSAKHMLNGTLARWAVALQVYPIRIGHRKVAELVVLDALSRKLVEKLTSENQTFSLKLDPRDKVVWEKAEEFEKRMSWLNGM